MKYNILTKFIQDISFEIPSVKTQIFLEKELPKYNVKCDVRSQLVKDNLIRVNVILKLQTEHEIKNKLNVEINYCAMTHILEPVDNDALAKIILIDVPTDIYPTIYEIFIFLFVKSGVGNINIQKDIDFKKLYDERLTSEKLKKKGKK